MNGPSQPNKPPEQVTVYNQQRDYTNSKRSKRQAMPGQGQKFVTPPQTQPPEEPVEQDGFFKATLKQAFESAIKNVVDPAIRNFLDGTITTITKTMI